MARGKMAELFYVNGTADSIVEAELSNWNGKALKIPRIEVPACRREDIFLPGVYFLIVKDDDDSDAVYIGEAENVKDRLMQHIRDYNSEKEKYYWSTAVIFVSRNLNKALIRYLESRLVELADSCRKYRMLTKCTYRNTVLKESQKDVMDEFIDNVEILLNALGYNILTPVKGRQPQEKTAGEAVCLHLERTIKDKGKVEADGCQTTDGFVVYKGSTISLTDSDSIPDAVRRRRASAPIDKEGILQEDMLFSSPSYAAMFVIGKSANGLTSWKAADGTALRDLELKG